MTQLSLDHLLAAARPGGASVLTSVTTLQPAAGPSAGVAPARYVDGKNGTFAFETRFVDGEAARVVVIDSKGSTLNRLEEPLALGVYDEDPVLSLTPRIRVDYQGRDALYDFTLPHRFSDAHIRHGYVDGKPVTSHPAYRAARDVTPLNARALLELSPVSLAFGAWDSTRKSHQARFRSAVVGETIGVLADQDSRRPEVPRRGAARVDSFSPSVQLSGEDFRALMETQGDEISPKSREKFEAEIKKSKTKPISGSSLGFGSIPPSMTGLGTVACSTITRSHLLSFAALRQLRFGAGPDGDAACRALLAAFGLDLMVRSQAELSYRANCDLVETERPQFRLDQRYGEFLDLDAPSIQEMDALLKSAIDHAVATAGIRWEGQEFLVVGNPIVLGGAEAEPEE